MTEKVLMRVGETVRARVMLYKAVIQTALIYRRKIWMVTGEMLKVKEGFHQWVARRIVGNTGLPTLDGEW